MNMLWVHSNDAAVFLVVLAMGGECDRFRELLQWLVFQRGAGLSVPTPSR